MLLYRDEPSRVVVVPNHRRIRTGTLRNILRQAGLTPEEFKELL
jgi:predicted RNA binding protein YcfA (HicA-like mRNA interferase family)